METLNRDEALLAAQYESNGTTKRAADKKRNGKQPFKRHRYLLSNQLERCGNWRTSLPTTSGSICTHI